MTVASKVPPAARMYNLHESRCGTWHSRAEAAAALWKAHAASLGSAEPGCWQVGDLGCGDEKLRGPLARTGIVLDYFGYDALPQSPRCQRLNLAHEVPNRTFDVVFCLGVLEYLADLPQALARLRQISPLAIVSYKAADGNDYAPTDVAARGWLHHFTAAEMASMFGRLGYAVRGEARTDEGRTVIWLLESSGASPSFGDYAMLTPFPIPAELAGKKASNVGDGFIEHAIRRRLAPSQCRASFSTRLPLTDRAIDEINQTKALIIAGANQLNDHYSVTPELDAQQLARIRVPVIPMGMGIHGVRSFTRGMSPATKTLLRALHERIQYSSWRCPATVDYLLKHCPELADQALMTGCPVSFGDPLLYGEPFTGEVNRVVATVTERHDFWKRETRTIDFVSRQFPDATKILSLHQAFASEARGGGERRRRFFRRAAKTPLQLHEYARQRGFDIYAPATVAECQELYRGCDLHVGSRLHAHLYFLSQAKRSFLSYVDDRSLGMSRATGFPLCNPAAWQRYLDYDFEQYRQAAKRCHQAMSRFTWSVSQVAMN